MRILSACYGLVGAVFWAGVKGDDGRDYHCESILIIRNVLVLIVMNKRHMGIMMKKIVEYPFSELNLLFDVLLVCCV